MLDTTAKVDALENISSEAIPSEVIQSPVPIILKQLVAKWPLVQSGLSSDQSAMDYLKSYYNGRQTIVCQLPPEKRGRLFYNDNYTELDYKSYNGRVDEVLDAIISQINEEQPTGYYIASNIIDTHFPGLLNDNILTLPRVNQIDKKKETVSIWIGNKTTATCHYDALDNIACCVVGQRRFVLFPPDQVENLYPGPLSPTPGGQVISLVDFNNPDFEKYPKFREALKHAKIAYLQAGDALFLPSMWWHHVVGLMPFNVLVNYWWNDAAKFLDSGMNAIHLAMLAIRDKPAHERAAWKQLFDYYIFDGPAKANAHLPAEARGFLEQLDEVSSRKLRALLLKRLNR